MTTRARALLLLLGALGGLCACEPRLSVRVSLPDDVDREALQLEISTYAPTDEGLTCEAFAWGEIDEDDLAASRIAANALGEEVTQVGSVPRTSRLLFVVHGGDGLADDVEDLVGCAELDGVGRGAEVEIPVQRRVRATLPEQPGLAGVRLDVTGRGEVAFFDPDDDTFLFEGLCVRVEDAAGEVRARPVRLWGLDAAGAERLSLEAEVPAATACEGDAVLRDLEWERVGPFTLLVRPRFSLDDAPVRVDGLSVPAETETGPDGVLWALPTPAPEAGLVVATEVDGPSTRIEHHRYQGGELIEVGAEEHALPVNPSVAPVVGFLEDGAGGWRVMLQTLGRVTHLTSLDGAGGEELGYLFSDPLGGTFQPGLVDVSDCEDPALPPHHSALAVDRDMIQVVADTRAFLFRDTDPTTVVDFTLLQQVAITWKSSACVIDDEGAPHRLVQGALFGLPGYALFDGFDFDDSSALPELRGAQLGISPLPRLTTDRAGRAVLTSSHHNEWELSRYVFDEAQGLRWAYTDATIASEPVALVVGHFFGPGDEQDGWAAWSVPPQDDEAEAPRLWVVGADTGHGRSVGSFAFPCAADRTLLAERGCQLAARDLDDDGIDELLAIARVEGGAEIHTFDFADPEE